MPTHRKIIIFLLLLALGLASFQLIRFLNQKLTEVKIDLTKTDSEKVDNTEVAKPAFAIKFREPEQLENPKEIAKQTFIQKRNIKFYDYAKSFSNCFVRTDLIKNCKMNNVKARRFIFNHLESKKRGYIIYYWSGIDAFSETHIFIEPDKSGRWQIILRNSGDTRYFTKVRETIGYSVSFKSETEDNSFETTDFLSILNENGKEIKKF